MVSATASRRRTLKKKAPRTEAKFQRTAMTKEVCKHHLF
jgi:hypothetical protein